MDSCGGEAGDRFSLSIWHSDIGIPIQFQEESVIITYEAMNSVSLSRGQRDVRPPVQMKRTPTSVSRVSKGDSDTLSSCEMKEEPELKPMQGNRAFF